MFHVKNMDPCVMNEMRRQNWKKRRPIHLGSVAPQRELWSTYGVLLWVLFYKRYTPTVHLSAFVLKVYTFTTPPNLGVPEEWYTCIKLYSILRSWSAQKLRMLFCWIWLHDLRDHVKSSLCLKKGNSTHFFYRPPPPSPPWKGCLSPCLHFEGNSLKVAAVC